MTTSNYQTRKAAAREAAIAWQGITAEGEDLSYADICTAGEMFRKLGRKYGLLREFRENAIPC